MRDERFKNEKRKALFHATLSGDKPDTFHHEGIPYCYSCHEYDYQYLRRIEEKIHADNLTCGDCRRYYVYAG